ncbi:MAG: hypothetical protein M3Z66_13930 [Chloroflexota bacterium]|nr:hypothetical protein [Chloroflexota bacterium]
MDIHAAGGSRAGLSHEKIAAVEVWRSSQLFDEAERAVLDLAEAMTATPVSVSDELFGRLQRHFDEAQLVELAAEIAFENFRARFNRTFEVEAQGFYKPGK